MTTLGIISDGHGASLLAIETAVETFCNHKIDRLIYLGDGVHDVDKIASILAVPTTAVMGNCDYDVDRPGEVTLRIEGMKILICHGHKFAVKHSLLRLRLRAEELGANIALYGHTHLQHAEHDDAILLLNPGSLSIGHHAVVTLKNGAADYEFFRY